MLSGSTVAANNRVSGSHPALPGHFPGSPVVPGVVLLGVVLNELARQHPDLHVAGIRKLKFQKMLLPDREFTVEFASPAAGGLRFWCREAEQVLAEGHFMLQDVQP